MPFKNLDYTNHVEKEDTQLDSNTGQGNDTTTSSVNNNIQSRLFGEQQNLPPFYGESSESAKNTNDCNLLSNKCLSNKTMNGSYEYSAMYRQNSHETKYRDDYNSSVNRIQYY